MKSHRYVFKVIRDYFNMGLIIVDLAIVILLILTLAFEQTMAFSGVMFFVLVLALKLTAAYLSKV